VFLATIVPLTTVALLGTYYIEYNYEHGVEQSITANLQNLGTELKRRLQAQSDFALGLSRANAIQEFLPLLKQAETGRVDSGFNTYRSRINHYFEGFQTILQGMYVMRLMDKFGNVYVKVSQDRRSVPVYEGISGMLFVEPEINGIEFMEKLHAMTPSEVNTLVLMHNGQQSSLMETLPLLDYVVPLYYEDELIGAISLTLFGESLDSILNHAPRLYDAKLFLVENNPDIPKRHGMILYDDTHEIKISQIRNEPKGIVEVYGDKLLEKISNRPAGTFHLKDQRESIYFYEIFPYQTNLASWIMAMRVPDEAVAEPFKQVRQVIWSIAGVALVISLFLGDIGVRLIARPIRRLSLNLLSYAQGEHDQRMETNARIDEIRDMEKAFNTMADSLNTASKERDKAQHMMLQNAKLASIGQMAAGIGHEINNPLNNILSYAKLLERSATGENARILADLKSLKEEALRASDIIRGILNFARQVPPHYAPFNVASWLQDTINLVRQTAKTAGIELAYDCDESLVIEGDRGQLQQALINLLINAIQSSTTGMEVRVSVTSDAMNAIIRVIDQGKGIAHEIIDYIYDPFYTTKPEGEGSGLGLSISLGIVERHRGKLIIENNMQQGVTATMTIPLKQEVA
jgi:two-component system NtrC family sensor kinase